ncbi:polyprenyl synthetase family protein [Hippea jasoniae]|uniref:polyprenyl synthetase family protein n=1 Tax=Hippea jasoniae TaxID=944479 RepID=UPI0005576F61|nr:polyprenyl synthetase family protein [Hippea jasoniae]
MNTLIKAAIKRDIDTVDKKLKEYLKPYSALVGDVCNQVIWGGKRLRPLIVYYSYLALGGKRKEDAVGVGAIIEMIHTASLLHDDIIDEALFRRGKPSANTVFGIKPAVLGGDYLYSLAFNMVLDFDIKIAKDISLAAYTLTEGEVLEIEKAFNVDTTTDEYLDIIYKKTAVLIEVSAGCGAILADKDSTDAFKDYGKNLGFAFQIKDDCLDYMGDVKKVGKDLGIDLKEGKITLPVFYAFERDGSLKGMVKEFFDKMDEKLLDKIIESVKQNGLDRAIEDAVYYSQRAKKAIEHLKDSKYKDYLLAIADYAVEREK